MGKKTVKESSPKTNEGKEGKHKFIGRSTCPHCVVQNLYSKGQVESFSLRMGEQGVEITDDFDELDKAIDKTKKAIVDVKEICENEKAVVNSEKKKKEVCHDDEEFLEEHLQDLEFMKSMDFENVRKNFDVQYIDDVGNYKELMPKLKKLKIDAVPTVVEENCEDKSCTKTGVLDPINMILHDAIAKKDTVKVGKVKDYLNKRRERILKRLESSGDTKQASKLRKRFEEQSMDNVVDNWWNK